jgi:(E)-4-hydroxy-3-methyl-but-2-enyl pyrophosphate reductase
MKVMLAAHSGFCFGVRRAIQMALDSRKKGTNVCTLGELIHNPPIVKELEQEGIAVCHDPRGLRGQEVIIRSHGVSRQEYQTLVDNGNTVIDATCPYVKRAQELVSSMSDGPVFILGDANHPEVKGMLSYGNDGTRVVSADDDFTDENWAKLSVVSQTTQKLGDLQHLVCKLLPRTLEMRVFNTICLATTQRQEAALCLAKQADLMIVIGGRNSANTRVLTQLCSEHARAFQIETERDLDEAMLDGADFVGLTAGASTPAEMVVKVYNRIKEIEREPGMATCLEDIPLFKEESC